MNKIPISYTLRICNFIASSFTPAKALASSTTNAMLAFDNQPLMMTRNVHEIQHEECAVIPHTLCHDPCTSDAFRLTLPQHLPQRCRA